MLNLFKALIMPHFFVVLQYGTFVALGLNNDKFESLNKRESTYYQLLDRAATTSLYNLRVQNMLIII